MLKSKGKAREKQEESKVYSKGRSRITQGGHQQRAKLPPLPVSQVNDEDDIDDFDEIEGLDDTFDVLSNLKERLLEAGYDTQDKVQILLAKKNTDTGEWAHVKTYQNTPPTKDFIAETFRGGEYLLRVKVNDNFVKGMTERFTIPLDIYPVVTKTDIPSGSGGDMVLAQTLGNLINKLDENNRAVQQQITEQQRNTLEMFMKMLELNKPQQVDEVEKFKQLVMLFELLDKKRGKDDINYGDLIKSIVGQTVGFSLDLIRDEQERKAGGGVLDKVIDKVGTLIDGVNLKNLVASATQKQIPAPTGVGSVVTPQQSHVIQQAGDNTNLLLSWFISQVIIAHQKDHDVEYLADTVMLIDNFKQLRDIIKENKNDDIISFLKTGEYAVYFNDQSFTDYFTELLDTVRDYDTLDSENSEEKPEEDKPKKKKTAKSKEVKDNGTEPVEGTGNSDADGNTGKAPENDKGVS